MSVGDGTRRKSSSREVRGKVRSGIAVVAALVILATVAVVWHGFLGGSGHAHGAAKHATWQATGASATLDRSDVAVVADGQALLSSDDGVTFTSVSVPDAANPTVKVYFLSPSLGWSAATTPNTAVAGTSVVTIQRTSDGGETWKSATLPVFSVPTARAVSITFLDALHGWVSVNLRTGNLSNPGVMFATGDGGATWTQATLPFSGSLYFENASVGWLVGSRVPTTRNLIAMTLDGGITWQTQTLAGPTNAQGGPATIGDPVMYTTDDGSLPVTYGTQLEIYSTRDSGKTWNAGSSFTLPGEDNLSEPTATSAGLTGYVAVGTTIYKTSDAGQTWSALSAAQFAGAPGGLRFSSTLSGWAFGFGGTCTGPKGSQTCSYTWQAQHTSNGGLTWVTTLDKTASR